MEDVTEGRIVHYVLKNGEHRAALVVRAWRNLSAPDLVNLYVFLDGTNDRPDAAYDGAQYAPGVLWVTSVHYDASGTQYRTWHWPERAGTSPAPSHP